MKKKLVIAISSLAVVSGVIIGGMTVTRGSATTPTPPDLTPQIQAQQTQLNNHEARITNTESDVKDLQSNTKTAPSTVKADVPVAEVTPSIEPAPQVVSTPIVVEQVKPTPVTVTAYEKIPVADSENVDCKFTYSDGTTYQWHWLTVEYNQGSRITRSIGKCDSSTIGYPKQV